MLANSVDSWAAASDSWVEVQSGVILRMAASSFSFADLCFTGSLLSHTSSSTGAPLRTDEAILA